MRKLHLITQNKSRALLILSLFYGLISIYLFNKYGVQIVNDSPRYLDYATNLNDGFYYDPLNFWYFSYVVFIYLQQFFTANILSVIISQYLLGYVAILALYHATYLMSNNKVSAFLASLLFIFFPDNLFWHSYILTESIYSSFLCITFFFAVRHLKYRSAISLLFLILSTIICFFCKPTAPAVVLAFTAPIAIKYILNPKHRLLKIFGFIVSSTLLLVLANQMIGMHRVMLIYEKGDIIFAIHEIPGNQFHDWLRVSAPRDLHIPEEGKPLIISMLEFVFFNPIYWIKLVLGKFILFISHIRPYWSWNHITSVVLVIWSSYYFAFVALKQRLIDKALLLPFAIYTIIHLIIVCNTWVDWDSRFFVPLFPILAFLAGVGLSHLSQRQQ